jgi:ribonucleoside-diphosphate reductase alpha chain
MTTVKKKSGEKELFDLSKIKKLFSLSAQGYEDTCTFESFIEAFKKNIVDDIATKDITRMMIKTCIDLVSVENIDWEHIAARIKLYDLYKEIGRTYSDVGYKDLVRQLTLNGKYSDRFSEYSDDELIFVGSHINKKQDEQYRYTTIHALTKRYLMKSVELPQEFYMSVALFIALAEKKEDRIPFAIKLYMACASGEISLPTPTLLNARTNFAHLSSCFKINIDDDLRGIYHGIENMAQISKFGGGIGTYLGHIRSKGSYIR